MDEEEFPEDELAARAMWIRVRNKIGDGYSIGKKDGPKVVIFVEEKAKNEKHFDTFAFLLFRQCFLVQVDRNDIVEGKVLDGDDIQAIIFPGGAVHSVHRSLTKEGAREVSKFVYRGGGYVGVCAGAFIASGRGYTGSKSGWQLMNVDTSWYPGVGTAQCVIMNNTEWVDGLSDPKDLYFANGAMFSKKTSSGRNKLINKPTSQQTLLLLLLSIRI